MAAAGQEARVELPYWIFADHSQFPGLGGQRDNEAVGPFASRADAVACGATYGVGIGTIVASDEAPAPIVYSPEDWMAHQTARGL
jgi:hypothetical protein